MSIAVTPENYPTAETSRTFDYYSKLAPINEFFHYRQLTPLDNQGVVRMNRDALYSGALVDTRSGAVLHFPEFDDDRYVSVMVTDNEMYVPEIWHDGGTYEIPADTRYVFLVIRVQILDPADPEEIDAMNRKQDQFRIEASSAEPYVMPDYDLDQLQVLHDRYNREFAQYDKYPDEWAGTRSEVDEDARRLAVAGAWGLFPNREATYYNFDGGSLPGSRVYVGDYTVPENRAFWSITVYGPDGKMHHENCILNSSNTVYNDDGGFTVHFGPREKCPSETKNHLDTVDGWNFLMRVYQPGPEVLENRYALPPVSEVA